MSSSPKSQPSSDSSHHMPSSGSLSPQSPSSGSRPQSRCRFSIDRFGSSGSLPLISGGSKSGWPGPTGYQSRSGGSAPYGSSSVAYKTALLWKRLQTYHSTVTEEVAVVRNPDGSTRLTGLFQA